MCDQECRQDELLHIHACVITHVVTCDTEKKGEKEPLWSRDFGGKLSDCCCIFWHTCPHILASLWSFIVIHCYSTPPFCVLKVCFLSCGAGLWQALIRMEQPHKLTRRGKYVSRPHVQRWFPGHKWNFRGKMWKDFWKGCLWNHLSVERGCPPSLQSHAWHSRKHF